MSKRSIKKGLNSSKKRHEKNKVVKKRSEKRKSTSKKASKRKTGKPRQKKDETLSLKSIIRDQILDFTKDKKVVDDENAKIAELEKENKKSEEELDFMRLVNEPPKETKAKVETKEKAKVETKEKERTKVKETRPRKTREQMLAELEEIKEKTLRHMAERDKAERARKALLEAGLRRIQREKKVIEHEYNRSDIDRAKAKLRKLSNRVQSEEDRIEEELKRIANEKLERDVEDRKKERAAKKEEDKIKAAEKKEKDRKAAIEESERKMKEITDEIEAKKKLRADLNKEVVKAAKSKRKSIRKKEKREIRMKELAKDKADQVVEAVRKKERVKEERMKRKSRPRDEPEVFERFLTGEKAQKERAIDPEIKKAIDKEKEAVKEARMAILKGEKERKEAKLAKKEAEKLVENAVNEVVEEMDVDDRMDVDEDFKEPSDKDKAEAEEARVFFGISPKKSKKVPKYLIEALSDMGKFRSKINKVKLDDAKARIKKRKDISKLLSNSKEMQSMFDKAFIM